MTGQRRTSTSRGLTPGVVSALAIVLLVTLAVSSSAGAQTPVAELRIEDVMKLDGGQVFGASERLQPAMEAPASVSFITAEEIARYGYRTLADILRSVRGFYVTDDRTSSLLGTRGFAKPGDYNSRVLLLVNGHRVNDNVLGQAAISAEFGLDPAIFERVEIIRGPASSLYGDSAFFAVVNIITRTGAALGGGSLTLEAGTLGTQLVRATAGHRLANGLEMALSSTYERSSGVGRLYFPAFDAAATNHGVAEGLDGEGVREFYGRLDFNGVTVTAALGRREKDVPTASYGTLFNHQDPQQEADTSRSLVDAEYGRLLGATRATFRASYDRSSVDASFPYPGVPGGAPLQIGRTTGFGTRWSVSSRLTRAVRGRQIVTGGVEFIDNMHQDLYAGFDVVPAPELNGQRSSTQHAIYVQDEIKPARWLIVNGGLRYDGYETFRRVTPRAALIVLPSATQSVKYLYGVAFRAPNGYELNPALLGERETDLLPESIDTHELVWERYINDWLRTSVSTYWYKAHRLITAIPDASSTGGISFVNEGRVRANGLELEAQMRLKGESRAQISYAFQNAMNQETRAELPNSPHQVAKARVSVPGPTPRSFVSVEGQYLSSRQTLLGSRVSAAATVNVTLIQPVGRSWEITGNVRNIFDTEYADPASSQQRQDAIPQNGRTARIGLRLNVWTP